ncbi:FkbM family methyltransferase [Lysobacter antibioticus]|uniref:Methyltransferase, FkbM family domain protein n=1 Tax=Lysobacter antibioticus TaxID=84531 RepID=A0A0S2F6Y0_LYSAN|nr:FkbM family methyltransferase [Lysobacter antibioticus]ALN79233.1 methyltransferase, FkbM family domain protein [Lysobacter antibioticus]
MSTFISYAQNFEDVILHRALADVEAGFYVDVGAQHPLRDSVTRAFYERGWRGINIEPVAMWHGLIEVDRPEDLNLRIAVGASEGEIAFFEVADSGLSTVDKDLAAKYVSEGFSVAMAVVKLRTLDAVLAEHGREQIHFLKIDVEGAEAEVLKGLSLKQVRPWIIVVEATRPNTQIDASGAWQHMLTDADYSQVYYDGLNCFFLAKEHQELADRFGQPPNFFDNFVRHADWERGEAARRLGDELVEIKQRLSAADEEVEHKLSQLTALQDELSQAGVARQGLLDELAASNETVDGLNETIGGLIQRAQHLEQLHVQSEQILLQRDALRAELDASQELIARLLGSRSWRLTAPVRWLSGLFGAARPLDPVHSPVADAAAVPAFAPQSQHAKYAPAAEPRRFSTVPGEARLLELARQAGTAAGSGAPRAPYRDITFEDSKLDSLIAEIRSLARPPQALPPALQSMPGANIRWVRAPILRIYERLFRKQTLINAKLVEALQIIKDRNV